jgi:hypothetical protein
MRLLLVSAIVEVPPTVSCLTLHKSANVSILLDRTQGPLRAQVTRRLSQPNVLQPPQSKAFPNVFTDWRWFLNAPQWGREVEGRFLQIHPSPETCH